jgi:putative transposase
LAGESQPSPAAIPPHSRKVKGSSHWRKHALKLARLHARIANLRRDWLHKTTSRLEERYSVIGMEDLNVKGMMASQKLARGIGDIGFHEFKRQLMYKSALYGSGIVLAGRWFPSSKTCSACGLIAEELPLSVREWTCACGQFHDRDVNAARNLLSYALTRASCARRNACGEEGSGWSNAPVKPSSVKQESAVECLSPV